MDQYVTGAAIKELREKNKMTQLQFAEKIGVSDKAVSRWETGRGYPDITLLEPIAKALSVSVTELLSGNAVFNSNVAANMLKAKFYVCPVCGNVICSTGETAASCHGILLAEAVPEEPDEKHEVSVEKIEDEYYVRCSHEMSKAHYISFIAALSPDRVQLVKLYPEGEAEARFRMAGVRKILYYCNRDGLYAVDAPGLKR